jgi:hypothetical protein
VNNITGIIALIVAAKGEPPIGQNLWQSISLLKVFNFGASGGCRFL